MSPPGDGAGKVATMLELSANISLLFREFPLLERFAAARAAGFPTVEIQIPYVHSVSELTRAARDADVQVSLINAPMGEDPQSFGTACLPGRAPRFRDEIERAAEYAHALGVRQVNVLAGRATPGDESAAVQRLAENFALAAQVLGKVGAQPLLEVLNPVNAPGYCVLDFELAAEILEATDARAGLQFDVYHAAMLGLEPAAAFLRYLPHIRHVQFADCPGRHEPGSGGLDFERIIRTIRGSGYAGRLGAEYHPKGDTRAGLGWMGDFGRFAAQ